MGIVYEAEQVSLGRRVALKVLPFAAALDPKQLHRFKIEAQAAAHLQHQNIVPVYAVGCERGVHFYAMQFIDGQTVAALIRELRRDSGRGPKRPNQPSPSLSPVANKLMFGGGGSAPQPCGDGPATGPYAPPSAARPLSAEMTPPTRAALSTERSTKDRAYFRTVACLGVQAAEALEHAHQLGVVHRDIKPANLLVDVRGNLWITDFGLAHCQNQAGLTMSGDLVGTLRYMSPEQALAKRVLVDHHTDIYSLGTTLYELLTLEYAFDGRDREELLRQITLEEPPLPRHWDKSIPAELEIIVLKAMEKNPIHRYGTAQGLADDLKRWLTGEPIQARRPNAWQRTVKWVRRRPALAGFLAASGVAALALLGLVVGLCFNAQLKQQTQAEQWMREYAIPNIKRLVHEKNYGAAFDLAQEAERVIASDPMLAEFRPEFTSTWSVITDPPGAEVSVKPYDRPDAAWKLLGRSPLNRIALPRGFFRWRITKEGYVPVEGIRNPVVGGIQFTLDRDGSLPPGMVRVSRNTFEERGHDLEDFDVRELEDYLIDRFEVTNRQFKEFVDQGGYRERKYWKEPFLDDKTDLSWEDAMKRFQDQTGKPGPSGWQSGTYPAGESDYPVRGVSWYEAAAYAEFVGKSLPTVAHWIRASGHEHEGGITPLSNFGRSGPASVGKYQGLGPFGTYDMAGNVKEWCWNQSGGDKRVSLGGSWDEPAYLFRIPDLAPALDRSPANGFRCARYLSDKIPPAAFKRILPADRDYRKETPCSDELFRVYKSMHAYDATPLNADLEAEEESADSIHETITLDAAYGKERVIVHFYRPRQIEPLYQAVVFFPGANYFQTKVFPRENPPSEIAFLVRSGRAVLWPVYKGSCERWIPAQPRTWDSRTMPRDLVIQWYQDLGRSLDYLQERGDIDTEKLAYYGGSRGGVVGIRHLAVDDRLTVGVLVLAGLSPNRVRPEIDGINFVSRVRVPILMLNGQNDLLFPVETSQEPMFRLLGTPDKDKRRKVYDVPGHSVPWNEVEKETLAWLDQYLGKVR
jgi:serine/threonine protein kinase